MSITLPNLKHSFNGSGSGSGSGSGFRIRIPGSGFPCFPYARINTSKIAAVAHMFAVESL